MDVESRSLVVVNDAKVMVNCFEWDMPDFGSS